MPTVIPAPVKATVTAKVEALLTDMLAPRHLHRRAYLRITRFAEEPSVE
jgi:hypothetical protein